MPRLLNVIITFNRPWLLRNTVESLLALQRLGDCLIFDNGSSDPEQIAALDAFEARGLRVLRRGRSADLARHGGLYEAMNEALDLARREGYELIQYLQDDVQVMWQDADLIERVEAIFAAHPDATQVSTLFAKKIDVYAPTHVESFTEPACYRFREYGITDQGFSSVEKLAGAGFRFGPSEDDGEWWWRQRGGSAYSLHAPVLAWVPWPQTFVHAERRGGTRQAPRDFYLKPLDAAQVAQLQARPVESIPYHEDYCLPWGWQTLHPAWFTAFNPGYFRHLGRYMRRYRALPAYVGVDAPYAYRHPRLRDLAGDLLRRAGARLSRPRK